MQELKVSRVKRSEINVVENDLIDVAGLPLEMSDASRLQLLQFSRFGKQGYQQAFDYLSPDKAAEMANELLQTKSLKDDLVSVLHYDDRLIGMSSKSFNLSPDQFLEKTRSLIDDHQLTYKEYFDDGYSLHIDLPNSMKLAGDVFLPSLNMTYDISGAYTNLGLTRLVCTNGMVTKTRGTTINMFADTTLLAVQNLLNDMKSNPEFVYAPMAEFLEIASNTPASLKDLIHFKNIFSNLLGEDEAEDIFKVERAFSLFQDVPEKPHSMWLETARLPISALQLYNMGTVLTSHKANSIRTEIQLGAYLTKQKPLANICNSSPRMEQLYDDVPLLMGDQGTL